MAQRNKRFLFLRYTGQWNNDSCGKSDKHHVRRLEQLCGNYTCDYWILIIHLQMARSINALFWIITMYSVYCLDGMLQTRIVCCQSTCD